MNAHLWTPAGPHWQLTANGRPITCEPRRGLTLPLSAGVNVGPLLGIEVVDAADLQPQPFVTPAEEATWENVLLAQFKPTASRPVECHARWRVANENVLDLEVSALTPGLWQGLAVTTASHLPPGEYEIVATDDQPLVIWRAKDLPLFYAEMCHPHDGSFFEVSVSGAIRFRLFEHDLEKGVILRGRLRGQWFPAGAGHEAVLAAYRAFVKEPANLSL